MSDRFVEMMEPDTDPLNAALPGLLARDSRYHRDAYFFLREALEHTQQSIRARDSAAVSRHISGRELLDGIRDHALIQYGPMARLVLNEWGIRRCEDFGELVFNLIEIEVLSKTAEDRREDFQGGYDFEEAFDAPYRPHQGDRVKTGI
jgi:uncharacterized repeat protein (TIGR04138 family)